MHDPNADVPGTEVDPSASDVPAPEARHYRRRWYNRMPDRLHIGALRYMGLREEGEFLVPRLRMRGLWLYLLGFRAGTWVTVRYDGKSLILTPEEPPVGR